MNKMVMIAIMVIIVIAIIYFLTKQNFSLYTSGATQRYASEFTSTNQNTNPIYNKTAFDPHVIPDNVELEQFTKRFNL